MAGDDLGDDLDVFCYHAPLGLEFPYPSSELFDEACDESFSNDFRNELAEFYRLYIWARKPEDVVRFV